MKKIMVIVGSVREGRTADTVLSALQGQLGAFNDWDIDIADLKDIELPFYNEPIQPADAHGTYKSQIGTEWAARVASADGFIMLTPEYNHSTSAVLKNAIDWVYDGWGGKPVAFIGWGGVGGARAIEHLRGIVLHVGLVPLTAAAHIIPGRDFQPDQSLTEPAVQGVVRTLQQLAKAL